MTETDSKKTAPNDLSRATERLQDIAKRMRKAAKLTQKAAEKRSGVSQSYISQLENGEISSPSMEKLGELSRAYGVDVLDFFPESIPAEVRESLADFLADESLAKDVTEEEAVELRKIRMPLGRPTKQTWLHLLMALRSQKID